jgi:CBS domain-containing protein
VRLRHQGRQVRDGEVPDNFVSPDELTNVERRHLRDVFQVVRKAQSVLAQTYPLQYVS